MGKIVKYFNSTRYLSIYKKSIIDDNLILLESQKGMNLNGNIFYLLKCLLNDESYKKYKIVLSVEKEKEHSYRQLLNTYHMNPKLVFLDSIKYYQVLSSAKYLITDTSFMTSFMKKKEQIFLNVWHGTPLKTLGRSDHSEYHSFGNIQKNFFVSDYLLYPNEYMMNIMKKDYMLSNLFSGKYLLGGYPRNEVFFKNKNIDIMNDLDLHNKTVIGYMPTYRGNINRTNEKEELIHILHYLYEFDKKLDDNQIMLVNLHPFVSNSIDFSLFMHLKKFPVHYETYEVLNCCDLLITDYSSVFFDYAITRKKIILFVYDEKEYLKERGIYISLDTLPFPKVKNIDSCVDEINSLKEYDDHQFINTYCNYENIYASKYLLDRVLLKKDNNIKTLESMKNDKKNILIYAGNLSKNGITTAFVNLMNHIETNHYNFYVTFSTPRISPHKEILKQLPKEVGMIPMMGKMNASLIQKILLIGYRKMKISQNVFKKTFDDLYQHEIIRCFDNIHFSDVIFYNGYEFRKQLMFGRFTCKKTIFVHTNIVEEIKTKKNQHVPSLRYAYNTYDYVAVVSEDMVQPTLVYCNDPNKIKVVNNIIDYQKVIKKSNKPFAVDENTQINVSLNYLNEMMSNSIHKFITIGRYSFEKGHERLITSFNRIWNDNPKCMLIIIGGYGALYEDTLKLVSSMESKDHIVLIKSLSNPYPLLKQCDSFVFTSFFEGFGLVLAEADILGLPVISTDILGPRGFMMKNNGYLVENNNEGIFEGMKKMMNKEVKRMNVNYKAYNEHAISQFEELLK